MPSEEDKIADGINNYFTYSQGYKSGGYNEQAMSATSALPFKEETADSFELGLKTETADRRLRFNAAAFYVRYDDLQRDAVVPFVDPITGLPGQETRTTNAGKAEVYGLELEASAVPVDGLTLSASLGYAIQASWGMVGGLAYLFLRPSGKQRRVRQTR